MPVSFPEIPRVTPDDIHRRLGAGDGVLIVDVRSLESFQARHITGARSVPADQLVGGGHGLPRDRDLVFY